MAAPVSGEGETVAAPVAAQGSTVMAPSGDGPTDGEARLPVVDNRHYELERELARGGMGKVMAARDRRLGRPLAIKVALADDVGLRARFEREAVLTARLQHHSIVPIYEAGRWPGGEPFYAMKLIEGKPLDRLVREAKTLDDRLALFPHVIAVTDAMAYAHDHRVIHRDLKPSNVIAGDYGETVVIDWGLAKDLAEEEEEVGGATGGGGVGSTVVGSVLGTPAYMPPEQAEGKPLDERADVYALGAILYHVLCGKPPYDGKSGQEIIQRVLAGPPEPLARREREAPRDLQAVVAKAMARAPADRYANAKQLADDLRRFERGQLVAAHAYSRSELILRWLLRHRAIVAVAGAAIVVVAVASGLWLRAELRERAAGQRRVVELLHADDTDHATAEAQKAASDFATAAATLEREVQHLANKREAPLVARYHERMAELVRVTRIAEFHRLTRHATFLVGDEDRGDEAIAELTKALFALGAYTKDGFVAGPWWESFFPDDVTPEQRRAMQARAYRTVLELAFMHFKQGALGSQTGVGDTTVTAKHLRKSLEVLAQTNGLEKALDLQPARVTRVWQEMALRFLRMVGTEADLAAVGNGPLAPIPEARAGRENADDYDLYGVGHYFVNENVDTSFGKGMRLMFPTAFDFDHPLDTAERYLRTAIRINPRLYWPHFMLGMTLRKRGDFGGSEQAFGVCIMLEPDVLMAYGQRAATFAAHAMKETDTARRDELIALALADSEESLRRDVTNPVTHWTRGDLLRTLDRRAEAVASYIAAVEREELVFGKMTRQIAMRDIMEYLLANLDPRDVDARIVIAYIAIASLNPNEALKRLDEALALAPTNALAQRLRALAATQASNPSSFTAP
jgi:tetratricopeptide (TPR) repeat protein/predicted Ser/Thr protein kinase